MGSRRVWFLGRPRSLAGLAVAHRTAEPHERDELLQRGLGMQTLGRFHARLPGLEACRWRESLNATTFKRFANDESRVEYPEPGEAHVSGEGH